MLSPVTRWDPSATKKVTSSINLRQEIILEAIWGLFCGALPAFCTSFCASFCTAHPDFRKVPHFPL
jgi:hypothetical protein